MGMRAKILFLLIALFIIVNYSINTWANFFLKYIISHDSVTCAIPATSKTAHMKQNMQAMYGHYPDATLRKMMEKYFEII